MEKGVKQEPASVGRQRQSEIYVAGISGHKPKVPVRYDGLRQLAQDHISPEAFAYVDGGAGMESTMAENRLALERWRIEPRMLQDVSLPDTSTELLGLHLSSPILLSPIGVLELIHRDSDLAVARAAAMENVPMIFSNQASRPMEECAAAMGGTPRWFQLYWSTRDELVESLVKRAERCGASAIVVTLDTTMLGWRSRDLDLAYLPFLRGKGIAQYTSDPVFQKLLKEPVDSELDSRRNVNIATIRTLLELAGNYPENTLKSLATGNALQAVRKFIGIYSRPSLTWQDLPFLRKVTDLPVLLKGIQSPADARRAIEEGVDGLIVSNHGGRQVDGAIGSLDALDRIASEVGDEIPLIFDSGIRTGADIFRAIALGARAVCLGRPWVWGLAIAGEAGVREVLQNFKADFELTMALAGVRATQEISRESLVKIER